MCRTHMAPPTFNMLEARLSEGLFGLPNYPLMIIKGMGVHYFLVVALPLDGRKWGKNNFSFLLHDSFFFRRKEKKIIDES